MEASQDKYAHLIGKVIDNRYEVLQVKGIGGMAVVLKAKDLLKNRTVAIKMLNEKNSNDNTAIRRFVNESKAIALLSNEHIVDIYDVAFTGASKYIVMEYIDGITLREYMKRFSPVGIDKAIDFTIQILSALQHAHEKGVVHRDIKPQNIMVQSNGKLKVTDFGIAQVSDTKAAGPSGVAMGTVYYISPEQASGMTTTFSSDIYSVGVMLYEMTTGRLPFEGDTPLAIAMMQVNNKPIRPRKINPRIPQGLEQIILKAMMKAPSARFRSAQSMLRACEIVRKDKTVVFEETKHTPATPPPAGGAATAPKPPILPSEKNKRKKASPKTMFPIILGVVTAFLLVASISGAMLVVSLLNMTSEDNSIVVPIPSLVGESYDDTLITSLTSQNIVLSVTEVNNDIYERGKIVSQNPENGQTRKIASSDKFVTIEIAVSLGKTSFPIGDYANQEYRKAKISIEKDGILVTVEEKFDATIVSGYVISTNPPAGTVVNRGDTVTLYVSKGAEEILAPMIDVQGHEAAEAKRMLLNANFIVGKITKDYSPTVPEGCVIGQSVAPGTKTAQKYTAVDLVISLGAY